MATNGTMCWPTLDRWNDIDTFERNEHFRKNVRTKTTRDGGPCRAGDHTNTNEDSHKEIGSKNFSNSDSANFASAQTPIPP